MTQTLHSQADRIALQRPHQTEAAAAAGMGGGGGRTEAGVKTH